MKTPVDATYNERVPAPPSSLFRAWTEPDQLKAWFGPDMFQTTDATVDLRVGGAYRLVMRAPDGSELVITGRYEEIVPNRRLVYTWAWGHAPAEVMRVHVEFAPIGADTTDLRIHHSEIVDGQLGRYASGWREGVNRLQGLLVSSRSA